MSWHIEGCTGACLACLIEETVRQHYGTKGLDFLRRKVGDDMTDYAIRTKQLADVALEMRRLQAKEK